MIDLYPVYRASRYVVLSVAPVTAFGMKDLAGRRGLNYIHVSELPAPLRKKIAALSGRYSAIGIKILGIKYRVDIS